MRCLLFAFFLVFQFSRLFAQEQNSPGEKPVTEQKLDSLKTIADPLAVSLKELEKLQTELKQAQTEDAKEEIQTRLDAERERVRQLRDNFRNILGGSEAAEYEGEPEAGATIQEQISDLVQPVLSELREATSQPRELDALKKSLVTWQERQRKTNTVLARIDKLIEKTTDPAISSELSSARRLWASRQAEATSQIAVITVRIDERNQERRSLWETLSSGFSRFFKSKGMNLLMAFLAAGIGFVLTRKIYAWLRHVSPVHKKDKHNFTTRISDVLAMGIAILVAIAGIVIVFYARGDWLLLTLVVIFLVGVVWTGKNAIPPYLEQIRMILNLGSVREGERVIYDGLPWKVSSLGFFTTFTNPNLQGGLLRIPIKDVMGMISRPIEPKESWFPTSVDDWVLLSDNTYGKMITQTAEQVVVLRLGGSYKTYPTSEFLAAIPENLSHGFRLSVGFGIDYIHQKESTGSILETLNGYLNSALLKELGRDAIRSVKVEFASAAASSLDYEIIADFDGSCAHRYNYLRRRLQSICVDACNENGWVIPFTQITVHQAEAQ
ncbi:hypothetical protein ACFSSA_09900 [Luteolibacter algae]|uniref:Small-conductance mechanosensitive channel n=1 Tax=Luteolibacter algae TaxID=454151 RepID=A0ABW5DC40_9BACT